MTASSAPSASPESGGSRVFARHTGIMFAGHITRALTAAILLVVAARSLGADGLGIFVSTTALVSILVPFGSLGSINLMMRRVAIEPADAAVGFSSALIITLASGAVMLSLFVISQEAVGLVNASWYVLALIGASDLLAYRLAELAAATRQALDWVYGTAFFPALINANRVAALALLGHLGDVSLWSFALAYCAASVATAAALVAWTLFKVGRSRPQPSLFLRQWREGLHFSFGLASQTIYNDVDKVMLARLDSDASAGVYASAYRAIDLACVPLRALFGAAYIRFFRAGAEGLHNAVGVAKRLVVPSIAAASVSGLLLLASAGMLPIILGPEFAPAVEVARWLAVIPFLRALHYLAADSLTGAGMQGIRTACQLGVAVLNIGLNLLLIPRFGLEGAIVSSIATDAALAFVLWVVVARRMTVRAPLAAP